MITPTTLTLEILSQRRYRVFVIIWAIASVFHMARSTQFFDGFDHSIFTLAIVFLIAKPSSIQRLMLFLAINLAIFLRYMPNVSNHQIFYALANVTILQALVYQSYKNKTFNISKEKLFDSFAPVIRLELIILYFFVVFHKLNSDFFNPGISCATNFYKEQNVHGILPASNTYYLLNAYLTIFIETLIPIFLCCKKTRKIGLLIGLLFHSVIAFNPINGFYDFSSAIFASYVLFMGYSFSNAWYQFFEKIKTYFTNLLDKSYSLIKLIVVILVFSIIAELVFVMTTVVEDYFRYIFWAIFNITFIYVYFTSISKIKYDVSFFQKPFKLVNSFFIVIPIVVFFNGMSPYLGLKTENSFSMFSNLRTEGGVSNHFIMPVSLQIFNYQKDVVEVISSDVSDFDQNIKQQESMTFFSFNRLVHFIRPKHVVYRRNGRKYTYDRAKKSTYGALATDNPLVLNKLLKFRSFNKSGPNPCSH